LQSRCCQRVALVRPLKPWTAAPPRGLKSRDYAPDYRPRVRLRAEPAVETRDAICAETPMTEFIGGLFARKGTYFVVVGAEHVLGAQGMVSQLRAKGFAVERR